MKIPSCYDRTDQQNDSAMTPMIDVVFLLLIFFVCASAVPVAETIISSPIKQMKTDHASIPEFHEEKQILKIIIRNQKTEGLQLKLTDSRKQQHEFAKLKELEQFFLTQSEKLNHQSVVLDIGHHVTMQTALEVYDLCHHYDLGETSFGVRKEGPRKTSSPSE